MQTKFLSSRQRFNIGFWAGLVAGIIASSLMLLLNGTLNGVSLPEVLGSMLTQIMPPPMFDYLHRAIGGDAKVYLFYLILVGQCVVFALSGALCNLVALKSKAIDADATGQKGLPWWISLVLALILWLFAGLVFLPLTGAGLFGSQLTIGLVNTVWSLGLVGLVFGSTFVWIQNWLLKRRLQQLQKEIDPVVDSQRQRRRMIIRRGLGLAAVGVLGVAAWRFITVGTSTAGVAMTKVGQQFKKRIVPPPQPNYGEIKPVAHLSPEVSSNEQFYVVSKNLFSDPSVNGNTWKLTVNGLVEQPFTLTYQDLMSMPLKKQYESMMCISNEVGGEYMSNALWEGIPLADLLAKAGKIQTGATKVVLHAADDYSDSIHLSKALEPTTLVAVKMNGETLPQGHGYPARLLVPGIYGMKHVKWITRIEVVDNDFQGYWQTRGWSDPAPIRLTSRIDAPLNGSAVTANKQTYIAGVAFSGNKGISQVDVSVDGGNSWQPAILKQPLSDLTWVLWQVPWQPNKGSYDIVVRAIDKEGNVQDPTESHPLPNGSSGYHTIGVSAL